MTATNTVIFDFDGTLVDSFGTALEICNALAPRFGYRTVRDEEVPSLRKLTAMELFRHLEIPLPRLPVIMARARREMGKEIGTIRFFDGMISILDQLRATGIQLGIVTSNTKRNVRRCLETNGVTDHFTFVHSATNLFGKHRTLRRLMRKYRLPRESLLYVGDEERDIEASKRCHIPVVAVTWGFQDHSQLAVSGPDFIADSPLALGNAVQSHFHID